MRGEGSVGKVSPKAARIAAMMIGITTARMTAKMAMPNALSHPTLNSTLYNPRNARKLSTRATIPAGLELIKALAIK
jgi:hypothetical protein